jgi:hypothetical protein
VTQGERGEKGARGRRGLAGGRGLTGERGKPAERLRLPRRVFIAFLVLAATNAGALLYAYRQQVVVSENQCSALNRLAETKLFIRNILVRTGAGERVELEHLTVGINALEARVHRLDGCKLFEFIDRRDRSVDKRYLP